MTNNKQQLSIEWLQNELERIDKEEYYESIEYINARKKAFQQAKEMHRQQAINLYYEYERYVMMNQSDEMINESVIMTFGQFYKQTYGGGEQ
jgi:hypothetical protein